MNNLTVDFKYLATVAYDSKGGKTVDVDTGITVVSYSIFIHQSLYEANKEYFEAMKFDEDEEVEESIVLDLSNVPVNTMAVTNDEWVTGDDYSFILHPYFAEEFFEDFKLMCDEYTRNRQ